MKIKHLLYTVAMFCLFAFQGSEQQPAPSYLEKIYAQTDRPLYFPGETIWYKAYVTKADGTPQNLGKYVYAQLISPKGTIAKNAILDLKDGYAYGDFTIATDWVGGLYKIRFYTNWMKNYGEEAYFEKEIVVQKVNTPNLLLKLEFDKKAYGKGASVIADFEVKDLKNQPLAATAFKYTVSIGGQKLETNSATTNTIGKHAIQFQLPDSLNTTDALINVLVPYEGSYESIARSIPVTLNHIDLQFLPEAGQAIVGFEHPFAFKALNEFGKPADVSGEIINDQNEVVTTFESFHDGMGSVAFTPKNSNYYARITAPFVSDSLIAIPNILTSGTTFSVTETNAAYKVHVQSSLLKEVSVTLQSAHQKIGTTGIIPIKNQKGTYQILKESLPVGIVSVQVKSGYTLLAERLLFTNPKRQLKVSVDLDKEVYQTRERVKVKLTTTDANDNPIPANLSVSVADNKLVNFADDKQDHILSSLLLSSELKGKIHKPTFYFDAKEPKAIQALDYVMLTHGWRSYISNSITPENAAYSHDTNAVQFGVVTDTAGQGIASHLLLFDTYANEVRVFDTDEKGNFKFEHTRNTDLILMAYTEENTLLKIQNGAFLGSKTDYWNGTTLADTTKRDFTADKIYKPKTTTIQENVTSMNDLKGTAAALALQADASNLEEVVVVGYGTVKKECVNGSVQYIRSDELSSGNETALQALQGNVAGVQITQANSEQKPAANVSIRGMASVSGNSQPLFVIDGVPYDGNTLNNGYFQQLNANNIDNITIVKGAAAATLYGSRGSNGVIVMTTKDNSYHHYYQKSFPKKKDFKFATELYYSSAPSTTQPKMFYMPVYGEKTQPQEERTDFRNTLYWNPVIQTDANGEANFVFYNSDAISSFVITTEGIGYNGLIGHTTQEYATKKFLHIQTTTPNYMALNDTVQIPIVIKNEAADTLKTKLGVALPKELQLVSKTNTYYTIPPNETVRTYVKVIPTEITKTATLSIFAFTDSYRDNVSKEITIVSPYFPMQASLAGTKNDSFIFQVDEPIEGSIQAEFNVYTDIVGSVMDGIEGIMRQPWGCFEQASSATYPNVLALQYLRETGKSNPQIEAKAYQYIKSGYKKLSGFETKKNGFEWYGDTPPHEALSAYGLMEFTEMKKVYPNVDEALLQRTIDFLMSRKNGTGGFKQHSGKYGFSGAPRDVNNAYIVYALSEAGVTADFEKEYQHAYHQALQQEDAYQMALLTCAAFNLNKKADAEAMLAKLLKAIETNGFEKLPVRATLTRSWGDAKQIETAAFTVMALLKAKAYDTEVMQGIRYLMSKRKYGRFGSSQATAMTLKALIAYGKTQKQKLLANNNSFTLTINGNPIHQAIEVNDAGRIQINNIAQYLSSGTQTVTMEFANGANTFPYELNIAWDTRKPTTASVCKVRVATQLQQQQVQVGETVRLHTTVTNTTNSPIPMVTAMIGIPSGASVAPWQLKELTEKSKADYVELFDNYLVCYWKEMNSNEVKTIDLDLKAEVPGVYQAPATNAYLYYTDEYKHWIAGPILEIESSKR
ncbi:TonB-dependent outer membrane receptor, SusC/RagA subfamily, signature region [Pustulibacterium marinum]|uniref:TonB-dependent outer membrane receptor, SusC/RagA subfamily, signature region n=1 Tax=Pustulibacterium marinum TaxID=1224947 RepID=A0A1I7GA52_9FLAO|nr:TonB-dependent receptor plug domain-containing protein [Pustulibacterium marinum]SFU45314.1 TonB-dependent outer membrane receptor, SusC/RagA subfamily, signature region [Pustulibacterium marinum]